MKAVEAISEILKREGIETIIGYPVNHVLEYAAHLDIRPIIVRQERVGLHMADAISRLTSGGTIGVFAMQHGPGSENAYGGIAQAYGESVPAAGDADGLSAPDRPYPPELQLDPGDEAHRQIDGADYLGRRNRQCDAPRLHPPAQRARRAGRGGSPR